MPIAKVLMVVEDDKEVRDSILDALSFLPIKIIPVRDGVEALEAMQKNQITAIISDINMPRMNGLELLQQIRLKTYETPFVILTGHADKNMAVKALRMGALDFVEKPFKADTLCAVAERALLIGEKIFDLNSEYERPQTGGWSKDKVEQFLKAKKEIEIMKYELDKIKQQKKVG
jgi:two-component system response regulator FlrC